MYELVDVTKNYQKGRRTVSAVKDLSLTIPDGEWLAVQGRTGHGKSTLLHMLGGLDRPSDGKLAFDDKDFARIKEKQLVRVRSSTFGFIFQTFNLVPTLSAAENVETALIPLGIGSARRHEKVTEALESVGLGDRARHLPSELSGGQQQRVAIARAIVKEPKVLLADEPTGNLDEDTRNDIIGLLERLWSERGLTMIMVTHDSVVAKRAQRVGVMKQGRLTITRESKRRPAPAPAAGPAPEKASEKAKEKATAKEKAPAKAKESSESAKEPEAVKEPQKAKEKAAEGA
jgi:putative ABC transport system ATP-binding protein